MISVIIPIYNCEKYLVECLDSVLAQTYTDWECVCVDDGSTDNSGKIVDDYANKDARFRVIHKPNGGEGSARNAGLAVFRGDWVYFLDSDDILNIRTLEICANGIANYPDVDLSVIRMVQYKDGTQPEWSDINSTINYEHVDILKRVDYRTLGTPVWSMAYKASIARDIKFTNLKVGADRVYVLRAIEKSKSVVRCDYVGYGYRVREGSIVNTAMTQEKFLGEVYHCMEFARSFSNGIKEYDSKYVARFTKNLMEYDSYCYFQMSRLDQKACLDEWSKCLLEVSHLSFCMSWRKYAIRLCAKCNSRIIYYIVFYLPFWLKVHGFNRKFKVSSLGL